MFSPPVIVTGAAHLELVESQANGFEVAEIIVEPEPKQTAAAVALAALRLHEDTVMLVCPSDHYIGNVPAFRRAAAAGADLARDGWLVCIAVAASEPDTRFGYVRRGERLAAGAFRVAEFVEKPDQAKAVAYLESGLYAWNGGIFAFRAGDYLGELRKFRPQLAECVERSAAHGDPVGKHFFPEAETFAKIDPESLDYAVMENAERVAFVQSDMEWSDVGNWEALFKMRNKDGRGNSVSGSVELIDCRNVLVDSDGPRVHIIGLENVVVVVDGEDILVASASGTREVASLTAVKRG